MDRAWVSQYLQLACCGDDGSAPFVRITDGRQHVDRLRSGFRLLCYVSVLCVVSFELASPHNRFQF